MKRKHRERQRGQGIIEVVAMCTAILIPVALMFMDALALVAAQSVNVSLTKAAARAAANAKDNDEAMAILNRVRSNFHTSAMIADIQPTITMWRIIAYDSRGEVQVNTTMTVNLPAPIPGLPSQIYLVSKAQEPIVSLAPQKAT